MNLLIVELSSDEALFARFRKKGAKLVFLEGSRHPVDQDHPFASLLPGVKSKGKEEEKVILAIHPFLLSLREVELPIRERHKIREILPLEIKGETAVETEELVFEALPLDGTKCLAIWAKRSAIAEHIRVMAEQGMEPEIVTASFFHWHTLIPEGMEKGTVALTDGEALAVYRDRLPIYFRTLGKGEVATEVKRTLAALEISKGISVERVFLHGGAARQVAAHPLQEIKGISFSPLPTSGILAETFPADRAAAADLAGACAVACGCSSGDPINFRRADLAYMAGRARTRRKLRLTIGVAAVIVALLFAEVGFRYFLVTKDLASLNNSATSIYRQIFPSRKKAVDEVAEIRSEIKRMSSSGESPLLPALKKLAELKGEEIPTLYEIEVEGDQLRVKGDAVSVQAANAFKVRAAGAFTEAELGEVKSRPDGSFSFSFKARMKRGEK